MEHEKLVVTRKQPAMQQSQVHEQLKMQYECSPSLVNANELENQIESIEAKLTKQSEDFSKSLRTCGSKGPELKSGIFTITKDRER
ncbi:hypothetical protein YC2023_077288 [Brassica napus]